MVVRRIALLLGVALLGLLAVQPISAYRDAQARLDGARADLAAARTEHARLSRDRRRADTPAFLEREARRLGYVRRGETPFVISAR